MDAKLSIMTSSGDSPETFDVVEWTAPSLPAAQAPLPGVPLARPAGRRWAGRPRLLVCGLIVLVAVAAGGWWTFLRPAPVEITYVGAPVANAGSVLDSAKVGLAALVQADRGVLSPTSSCYFQRPSRPAAGARRSDIGGSILCGPVLFFDGSASRPYLSFPLTEHPGVDGTADLFVAAQPTSPDPAAVPPGVVLVRPAGTSKPRTDAGIKAPVPPPAMADLLTPTDLTHPVILPRAPSTAVIGSNSTTVTLQGMGPVADFGSGIDEQSTPTGQKLLAFELAFGAGENLQASPGELVLGVSIGGLTPRQLPLDSNTDERGQEFVVAVSPSVTSVDLVLTDGGITQRLSLLTGLPAPTNITLLQGPTRQQAVIGSGSATALVDADGQQFTAHLSLQIFGAALGFFMPSTLAHPASTSDAFLVVGLCFTSADFVDTTTCYRFRATDLTVTPTGGEPIRAEYVPTLAGRVPVFEVPANFTIGTVTVAGSEASGEGWSMAITQPYSYPLKLTPRID
jgi:hypothetical protein